jgi:hypothetical protein
MATCDEVRDDLLRHATGRLAPSQRDRVERHLRGCPACRVASVDWAAIRRAVRAAGEDAGASAPPTAVALARVREVAGERVPDVVAVPPVVDGARVGVPGERGRRAGGAAALRPYLRWFSRVTQRGGGRGWSAVGAAAVGAAVVVAVALGGVVVVRLGGSTALRESPASVPTGRGTVVAARNAAAGATPVARIGQPTPVDRRVAPVPASSDALLPGTPIATVRAPVAERIVVIVVPGPAGSGAHAPGPIGAAPAPTAPAPGSPDGQGRQSGSDRRATEGVSPTSPPQVTPTPTAPAGAIVAGVVRGAGGIGRAEVTVVALPVGGGLPLSAATDVTGAFALNVPAGRWLVGADAPGYQSQWFPGRGNPFDADTLDIRDGDTVTVGFDLATSPNGMVTGRVTRADGSPAARAVVMGSTREGGTTIDAAVPRGPAVLADDQGRYVLRLPEGNYVFAVAPDWSTEPTVWWYGRRDPSQADTLSVDDGQLWDAVDFVLP